MYAVHPQQMRCRREGIAICKRDSIAREDDSRGKETGKLRVIQISCRSSLLGPENAIRASSKKRADEIS